MGKFTNGLIVGVGVALLVAPMRGEEMRRLVSERVATLRTSFSEGGQGSQYLQLASERVSQTADVLKNNAQQAATQVQATGSELTDTARRATKKATQTSQDEVKTTTQTTQSIPPSTTRRTNTPSV